MITLHQGSILDARTDYIVNPANSFLRHSGGLAKVIESAATDQGEYVSAQTGRVVSDTKRTERVHQWMYDHVHAPLIATGNAHMTSAGALPYEGVIHAVGPIWNGGTFCERDLLELALESSFGLLPGGTSVAIPAISSGVFGMPIEIVARVSVSIARWYVDDYDIQFWLFSDEHMATFRKGL